MRKNLTAVLRAGIVVAALAFTHPAPAAPTFTVNDTADDLVDINPGNGICSATPTPPYTCTLRAAFMEASHTSGLGATIVIPAGTYTLGISATPSDDESSGDLNLTTPASGNPIITITGAGADKTIIDANQIDRVLHIHAGRTVNITGVKIRNGYTTNDGGGIWNEGVLTLTACTIGGSDGEGNLAHAGGGIKNDVNAQLNVDSSTFSSNFCAGANASGGGLFNRGDANLSTSTFSGNYANIFGGAIYSSAGAILYLDQSVVDNNSGTFGSGIGNEGTMYITAGTISGNYGYQLGGGIYNAGTINIYASAISGNGDKLLMNQNLGGGIFNAGQLVMETSIISGNASFYGGGIYNNFAPAAGVPTPKIRTSTISGNGGQLAYNGGGIFNNGSLELEASTISNNTSIYGAGIDNSKTLFVTNTTISGNSASGGNGGGIANRSASGIANIFSTTIVLNVAGATNTGGGVYNDSATGAVLAMRNTLMLNNYAPSVGQYNECAGTLEAYGNNLIGAGVVGLPPNCTIDLPGFGSWLYLNPPSSLGPLQNNGGPTWTHALLAGSNAIDYGDPVPTGCINQNGPILTDQRGLPRTIGTACDIGAFEYQDRIFKNSFE